MKWTAIFLSAHQRPTAIRIPGAIALSSLTKSTAKPLFKTISGHTQSTLHSKIENIKCQKVQMVDVKMIKSYQPGSQTTIFSPIAREICAAPDVHLGVHSLLIQVMLEDFQTSYWLVFKSYFHVQYALYIVCCPGRPPRCKLPPDPSLRRRSLRSSNFLLTEKLSILIID